MPSRCERSISTSLHRPVPCGSVRICVGEMVVIDLRCQFGWRSSPGFWSLFSSALEHSHTHITFQTASVLPAGVEAVVHIKIVSPNIPAVPLPRDGATIVMDGGFAGAAFLFDTTLTMAFWLKRGFSGTAAGVVVPYNLSLRINSACWAFAARRILRCCLERKSPISLQTSKCSAGS